MCKQRESGTKGRVWHTSEANNIAFSLFLEANCNIDKTQGITIEIAETLIEVFRTLYDINLEIKHPNDIVFGNKKIGGILTQTKVNGECVKWIVIGIGINTNQEIFIEEIREVASSIKNEFGIAVDNEKVISEFLEIFEKKMIKRSILT